MLVSGVQRSSDARDDCLIGCPLPNSSIEQWRRPMVVISKLNYKVEIPPLNS